MSQTELGRLVGVSQTTITAWENNKAEPTSGAVTRLAEIFNISTDYLLGSKKENIDSKEKTVDELINQMQQYEGRPITDADRETIRGIIKGYLNVRPN
ncbi:hypothetical protein FC21_GL001385 [Limosilactobacillus equigenerosi DSM 18793 = JCM 14505]|uniref:HTH cro/C1-type domain-containing protein n=2 Tax=Limosilactobacillus TaxID=2742598 RepID=A0A0R1UQN3_9LACO|nr:hypothetical protein FC21_GL001385 [Limosilactobacillus equigenerosi DSM 18793 = JCM 14505]